MSEVTWSATYIGSPTFGGIANKVDTLMPQWADDPHYADGVVAYICADYFNDEIWCENFGSEDTCATIRFDIHSPKQIAGRYEVALERRTHAKAYRVEEPAEADA